MKNQYGFLLISVLLMTLMMSWTGLHLLHQSRLDILMAGAYHSLAKADHRLEDELNQLASYPGQLLQQPGQSHLLGIVPCHRFVDDTARCQLWLLEAEHHQFRGQLYHRRTIVRELSY